MKKTVFSLLFVLAVSFAFGQQKYALVIGNGAYTEFGSLNNAVNDADDMAAALRSIGFTVDKLINASLRDMDSAAVRLKERLAAAKSGYGFLFYAGHGVQLDGVNYLIPADANIPDSAYLETRAFPVQAMLDMLNTAGNALNVVVLDACRNFPSSWSRNIERGLSVVTRPPADSIIVYATAAGKTASDGKGRNGLFTGCLLKNLTTPGLEINEVIRRTGRDVARQSNDEQRPATYISFYETAVLADPPSPARQTAASNRPAAREKTAPEAARPPAVTRVSPNSAEAADRLVSAAGGLIDADMRLVAASLLNDCLGSSRVSQFIGNHASRNNGNPPVCRVVDFINESSFHISTPAFSSALETAVKNSGKINLGTRGTNAALLLSGSIKAIEDRAGSTTVRTYFFYAELTNVETRTRLWVGENSEIKKVIKRP